MYKNIRKLKIWNRENSPIFNSRSFHYSNASFFKKINIDNDILTYKGIIKFFKNEQAINMSLEKINPHTFDNYMFKQFSFLLSWYSTLRESAIKEYFEENITSNELSYDFVKFCIDKNISLNKERTLESFSEHNKLSGNAIEKELLKLKSKQVYNFLGFGLDKGEYEKSIGDFLIRQGKAKEVNIYGFDPYATRSENINYISEHDLRNINIEFDFITARWVLHHVGLNDRWGNFIDCIKCCKENSNVFVVEHGFMKDTLCFPIEKKLYHSLNAIFDVVANIGLRPNYLINNDNKIGNKFFIDYLEEKDFLLIKESVSRHSLQNIYDVGPGFPNQTICHMTI